MTTGYGADTAFDLELDELPVEQEVRSTASAIRRQPVKTNDAHGVALHGEAWSSTDNIALQTILRRNVRTIGPFVCGDLLALAISGLLAHLALSLIAPGSASVMGHAAPFALFPLVFAYWMSGLYSEIWIHPVVELKQLTHVGTIGMLTAAAVGMLLWPLPLWCLVAWMGVMVFVPLMRGLIRRVCGRCGWWGFPTLVIATGTNVDQVTVALLKAKYSSLRPVLLTDPEAECRASLMPVVNDPAILESLVRAKCINHAVVSLPEFSNSELSKMLDQYSGLIPHILVWSDAATLPALWGASRSSGRLSGLEIRNSLLLSTLQSGKRVLDLAIAGFTLLMAAPVMLVICALIKKNNDGPIFFGHTRIGRHGRLFKAWKFRTMHTNGDAILREHFERYPEAREEWDRDQKLRNDPRVTKLGEFLRKTSLDELPQVWNVLTGEMSLVGPRPIVKAEVCRYGDLFRLYTNVKPGITGLWQASGRTGLGYEERVQLDEFYVRHWSPWLDIYILAKTVVALIKRDGAC